MDLKQGEFVFECEDCEDREVIDWGRDTFTCECGGTMHSLRYDNYVKIKNRCIRCANYATVECVTCRYNGELVRDKS